MEVDAAAERQVPAGRTTLPCPGGLSVPIRIARRRSLTAPLAPATLTPALRAMPPLGAQSAASRAMKARGRGSPSRGAPCSCHPRA